MGKNFVCSSCGNSWSEKIDKDGLYNGYINAPCPICENPGSDPKDYGDFICPSCNHKWRNYGNGGLVLGCWPNCPKCGTMANEA